MTFFSELVRLDCPKLPRTNHSTSGMYRSLFCSSCLVTTKCPPASIQSSSNTVRSFVTATPINLFQPNRLSTVAGRNLINRFISGFFGGQRPMKGRVNTFLSHTKRQDSLSSMASALIPKKCLVAVCQLTSKEDKEQSFKDASDIVREAAAAKCKLVFLPECFDMVCESRARTLQQCEPINGLLIQRYQALARELNVFIFLGGLHERNEANPNKKCSNAHIAINDQGEIISIYRKLHLFNLDVPGTRLVESEFSVAGDRVEPPVDTPAGKESHGLSQ